MTGEGNAQAATLPSGTVTFVFTDIERSTEVVSAVGDERFAELQQTHRELLRDAFASGDGVEVRVEGDALFVAFERAGAAVGAAILAQRAIETYEWPDGARIRVRIGLHTGDAAISGGDYVGHDVHKASRICDAGHGGQILLSEATAALVEHNLPASVRLVDLGLHRLKDLPERQRLIQLTVDLLQERFPPPRTLDSFTHNLPLQRSPFVGRQQEIAVVQKLLEEHRLVSLTGTGGCGKTRLALQVGAEALDRFPDGVFFVELASFAEPSLVARVVAQATGIILGASMTGGSPAPMDELIVSHLRRKEALLVFDNCEHLVQACAELADRILATCPKVRILATTREVLDIEGEQAWLVPSLQFTPDAARSEPSDAVRLFEVRARTAKPDFELTAENLTAVTEICARLDGIPLAIELAASRISHLSVQQISKRLDDMFHLLTGGRRRVQRQQTLEASLDWSHDLLADDERTLFRRLAVFRGGFGLDAAEAVCSDDAVPRRAVIDLLGSLVTKSLVMTDERGGDISYRLLEPVRLYAADSLRRAGELERFRSRHRDRYVEWVASFPPDDATFGFAALRAFETEHDNLRAALEWSSEDTRNDLVASLANGLLTLWWNGGHYNEGYRWLTAAIERYTGIADDELASAYAGLTACSVMRVDGRAREYAARAIETSDGRPSGALSMATALDAIAAVTSAEASRDLALISDTRERARQAIDAGSVAGPAWRSFALVAAGQVELVFRDVGTAAAYLEEALKLWQTPSVSTVASGSALAVARHILGDARGAVEAAQVAADLEDEWWQPGMGSNALALALAGVGDPAAKPRLAISINSAMNRGVDLWLNEVLIFCGAVAFLDGDADRASRLMAAGRHLGGAKVKSTPFRTGQSYALYLHYIPLIRDALGPQAARRTRVQTRAMSLDEAVAYATEGLDG